MGVYASYLHKSEGQMLIDWKDPSQANWITEHAAACKMTVPEVQRCWSRFLMLQPDRKGNVSRDQLASVTNVFGQKLLDQIPLVDEEQITFQSYCNAVSWLSKSPLETKLRVGGKKQPGIGVLECALQKSYLASSDRVSLLPSAMLSGVLRANLRKIGLFQAITSGTVGKEHMQTLLHKLYPREDPKTIHELATLYLHEVDKSNQGYIDEDQFVAWVQTLPQHTLTSVMHFPIIPSNITFKESQPPFPTATLSLQNRSGLDAKQLLRVAVELTTRRRDWKLLANNLGFLEKDCAHLEHEHRDTKSQILAMLQIWQKSCQEAPLSLLQAALRGSGNVDICNEVFSLNF